MPRNIWYSLALHFAVILLVGLGIYTKIENMLRPQEAVITGTVWADSSVCVVTASNSHNSLSTGTDSVGGFTLRSVPAGTYSVRIEPMNGILKGITLRDVHVIGGKNTELGRIELFRYERPASAAGNSFRGRS